MNSPLSNSPQTPIKAAFNQNVFTSDPKIMRGTMSPVAYSTVQPVTLQPYSTTTTYQPGLIPNYNINQNQRTVIHTGTLQPTRQISTVQPYYIQANPSIIYTQSPQPILYQYPNVIQHNIIQSVPVQQKIIEQIKIQKPQIIQQGQPQVKTIVKRQYVQQPKVELVKDKQQNWDSYYSTQKYYAKPPIASAVQQPTGCHPAIWGILGLLALAGLITGIVLAAKASGGSGSATTSGNTQTPGVPSGNSTTIFTPPTTNTTNTTTTTTSNTTVVQPTITNPITIAPSTITTTPITTTTTANTTTTTTTTGGSNTTTIAPIITNPTSNSTSSSTTSNSGTISPSTSTSTSTTAATTTSTTTTTPVFVPFGSTTSTTSTSSSALGPPVFDVQTNPPVTHHKLTINTNLRHKLSKI